MSNSIAQAKFVVGIDVGTKRSHYTVLDREGAILDRGWVASHKAAFLDLARKFPRAEAVIEAGGQSAWIERCLREESWDVITVDAARVAPELRCRRKKSDKNDSANLAELRRINSSQLSPIEHKPPQFQDDYSLLRARAALVRCRTKLVNAVRGMAKASGTLLPKCSAASFAEKVAVHLPSHICPATDGLLKMIAQLSTQIADYDAKIEQASTKYLVIKALRDIPGVGPLTAVAFTLVIFRHQRFARAKDVSGYLGLVPGKAQSGDSDPQCRITRRGNTLLRGLLLQAAHYIIEKGPDCDLKTWAVGYLAHGGGKNAKKRAAIAVARRLAVRMLAIWKSGAKYDPFHGKHQLEERLRRAC